MGTSVNKPFPSTSSSSVQASQNEKDTMISSCQMKLEVGRVKFVKPGSYDTAKTFELYVDANNCIPQNEGLQYQYYVEGADYSPYRVGPVQLNSVAQINDFLNRLDLCSVPIQGTNIKYAVYAEAILSRNKSVIRSNKVTLETLPDEFGQCGSQFGAPIPYPNTSTDTQSNGYCPPDGGGLAGCYDKSIKSDK